MEDILEDRRRTGDWWWVARSIKTPVYRHRKPRTPQAIKEDVLQNRAVQAAIDELVAESGKPRNEIEEEARSILDQMGHGMTMKAVRFFGVLLSKTWKRIYRCVNVNVDGIEMLKKLVPLYPIVLMPTHRSYVDFLVISYAFFYYDLPIPVVAAGQDFLNMKVMGTLMRNAGAFFIRRSFGKDKLYWTVFSEYVKTHIANGDAPMEFFIEGTRSRSAKSLSPKLGLFTSILETFFKADVPDIMVVPVSISYDRTLEEVLYAYELLGVPKPKETTRGLLSARKILDDDYGDFYMHVGKPISVREYCGRRVDRTVHNLGPRHLSPLSSSEHQIVDELAHRVIRCHQRDLVLSPFVLVAAILSGHLQRNLTEIRLDRLVDDTRWLHSLLKHFDANVVFDHKQKAVDLVVEACKVHHNVVHVTEDGMVQVKEVHTGSPPASVEAIGHLQEQTLIRAVGPMLLSHYSNQMLNVVAPVALVAVILNPDAHSRMPRDRLRAEYHFLLDVLSAEFIFDKETADEELDRAVSFLALVEAVQRDADGALTAVPTSKVFSFLIQLFDPFLSAYNVMCLTLSSPAPLTFPATAKGIALRAQEEAERLLLHPRVTRHQFTILSLDTMTNAVTALQALCILKKELRDRVTVYQPAEEELLVVAKRLEPYSEWLLELSTAEVLEENHGGAARAKL